MIPEDANENKYEPTPEQKTLVGRMLGFCIYNKLVVALGTLFLILLGIYVAPFDWDFGGFQRNPVSVDAIPDIGENQQIVFTEWPGRSLLCCRRPTRRWRSSSAARRTRAARSWPRS